MNNKQEFEFLNDIEEKEKFSDPKKQLFGIFYVIAYSFLTVFYWLVCIICKIIEVIFWTDTILSAKPNKRRRKKRRF